MVMDKEELNAELKARLAETKDNVESWTDDYKADVQKATEQLAAEVAIFKKFWEEWMPGGLRKRKRYRTKGHGLRRTERRRKNKVARASRKRNRPPKKRRSR
jgi:hypothetical protein